MAVDVSSYRLPTEAEWEYVCKIDTRDSRVSYDTPWFGAGAKGVFLRCNVDEMRLNQVKPNSLGLYVMRGNLSELVSDWFAKYEEKRMTNPFQILEAGAQTRNLARGGDLMSMESEVTASYRKRVHPEIEAPQNVGARIVLPLAFDQIIKTN